MPDPIPVIENHGYNQGLVLIDGGDGKYYLWHDVSDDVFEVYERNLTYNTVYIWPKTRGLRDLS